MKIDLIAITPNSEETIERAARTCYKSKERGLESRSKFLQGLVKSGHTSTIEHAVATFKISEVSRALTHQLVRHRMASYSQQSQRYCSFDKTSQGLESWYVTPKSIESNQLANEMYKDLMAKIEETCKKLNELGIKNEDSRFVLPNAAKTEIVMTANFREWRHFIEMRADSHAQWEIQELARAILDVLAENAPSVFEDLKEKISKI